MTDVKPDGGTVVFVTVVSDNIEVRSPELKLSLPVDNGRQRSTDQERTVRVTLGEDNTSLATSSQIVWYSRLRL